MTYNEFKEKYNGKVLDYDGSYGGQCWDLAQYYFTECLGLPASILSGVGYVGNMLNEPKISLLLKYFDEVPTTEMIPGDVVIWERHHIAIFDNWDGKSCWYLSQNNAGTGENPNGATEIARIGLGGVARAFRKKGWKKPEVKPEVKPEEPKKEEGFKVGDKVKPIKLVDYYGTHLVQYDEYYTISEIKGDRAVLVARGQVWAAMNTNNIKRV